MPQVADTYMASLQAGGGGNLFSSAASALGFTSQSRTQVASLLGDNPTNAAWLYQDISLNAGDAFSMAWQYVSTDYDPFNDASLTSLINTSDSSVLATVNNTASQFSLLGATVPNTGNYATGSYGATGWQVATYSVATAGTYRLGFISLNLGDTINSPILFVDQFQGLTYDKDVLFEPIAPNPGSTAPTAPPTTPVTPVIAPSTPATTSGLGAITAFAGGILTVDQPSVVLAQDFTISGAGGTIDQNGLAATFGGVFADAVLGTAGALNITNSGLGGSVTLTGINAYTGATNIGVGAVLALTGDGSIASSNGVSDDGTFDISGTDGGTSIQSLGGTGIVALGDQTLTVTQGHDSFGGAIDGAGELVVTGGTQTLAGVNSYTGGTTVSGGTLALSDAGTLGAEVGSTTVNGGTLDLGGTSQTQAALQQTGGIITNGTINVGTYGLTGGGLAVEGIVNAATSFALVNGEVDGSLVGTGTLNKTSDGTVVLAGVNNYTGGTVVDGGTLTVSGVGTLGVTEGTTTVNGGTLDLGGTKQAQAALNQAGGIVTNGTINVGSYGLTGGNLALDGIVNAATSFALVNGAVDGSLGGTGTLNKTGDGTVVLAGINNYTGGTVVEGGTLAVTGAGTLGVAEGTTTVNGGALDLGTTTQAQAVLNQTGGIVTNGTINVGTYGLTDGTLAVDGIVNAATSFALVNGEVDGSLVGTGTLNKTGDGTVVLAGLNNYTGGTIVDGGTLAITGAGTFGVTEGTTAVNGGALDLGGTTQAQAALTQAGGVITSGTINVATYGLTGGTLAFDGIVNAATSFDLVNGAVDGSLVGTGTLNKTGDGTVVLAGVNNYTGGTVVDGGTLAVTGAGTLGVTEGTTTVNGGTLDLGTTTQAQVALNQTGGVVSNGTVNVGTYGLTGGTLAVDGIVNAATAFTVATGQVDGILTGTGALDKVGGGTVVLLGNNSYSGGTTISGGTLALQGSLSSDVIVLNGASIAGGGDIAANLIVEQGGTLAGGTGGSLSADNITLNDGAIIEASLGSASPGQPFVARNDLVLDGTINVTAQPGFGVGVYHIFNYGGVLTDNGLAIGTTPGNLADYQLQTVIPGQINLVNATGTVLNFWDGSDPTKFNDGIIEGGSGTWSSTSQNWTDAQGTANTTMMPAPGFAIFQSPGGTVTVDNVNGQVGTSGMQFASDGYVVSGGALELSDPETVIRVGDGSGEGAAFVTTIDAALVGSANLVKTDLGTLILAGTNSYSGGTTVNDGTLLLAGSGTLGAATGTTAVNGGVLDFGGTTQSQAALNQAGGLVANGTINVDSYGMTGGTLAVDGIVNAATSFDLLNGTIDGSLVGAGTLNKIGDGTVVLAGVNGYTGGTVVDGGTLAISGVGTLGATEGTTTVNDGTLDFGGTTQMQAALNQAGGTITNGTVNVDTYGMTGGALAIDGTVNAATSFALLDGIVAGTLTGTGALNKIGDGTVVLAGVNSYTGGTTIDGGTVAISELGTLGVETGTTTINGGALDFGGTTQVQAALDQSGGTISNGIINVGTYGLTGGTLAVDGIVNAATSFELVDGIVAGTLSGTGTLNKTGEGTVVLAGVNGYTGGTVVGGGTLAVSELGTLGAETGTTTVDGGTLDFGGTTQVQAALNQSGGTVANGIINVGTYGLTGGTLATDGTVNAATSFDLIDGIVAGTLTGTAALNKTGDGTVVLAGINSYTGGTTIDGGTLEVSELGTLGAETGTTTINGGALDLGTTTQVQAALNQAGGVVSNGTINVGTYGLTGGTLAVDGIVNAATAFVLNAGDIQGSLVGTGTLTKAGDGTVVLAGVNSYTGGTVVDGGTLAVSGVGTLGVTEGTTTVNGGTLDLGTTTQVQAALNQVGGTIANGTVNVDTYNLTGGTLAVGGVVNAGTAFTVTAGTVDGTLTGTGALTKTGDGTVVLAGDNSYTGGTTISGGVLALGNGGETGSVLGDIANDGVLVVNHSNDVTIDGVISGTGMFVQAGTGVTNLAAVNNYSGGTLITSGTLTGTATSFGTGAIVNNATLIIDQTDDATFANALGGIGSFVKTGESTVTFTAANSYTGGTVVEEGTLALTGSGTLGAPAGTTTVNGGVLDFGGTTQTQSALQQTGGIVTGGTINVGTYALTGGTLAADATVNATTGFEVAAGQVDGTLTGTGALIKTTDGTVVLTGTNSYTGGTTIAGGTLSLGDGGTTGSIIGNITNNGVLAVNHSNDVTIAGAISGSGAVTQVGGGSTTLAGVNSYTGGTTITAGTLVGTASSFGSGPIVNDAALVIDQSTNGVFANSIAGTGSLTKRGAGTVNLTANSRLSGTTTVAAGGLAVNASFARSAFDVQNGATLSGTGTVGDLVVRNGGTLAPGNGDIGALRVNGNLVQQAGSAFRVQLGSGGSVDSVIASGSAQIAEGAQLSVSRFGGIGSTLRGRYTILSAAGGVTGTYTLVGDTRISAFFDVVTRYDPTNVFLDAVQSRRFVDAGQTRNQVSAAGAIQGMGLGNAVFNAVGFLGSDQQAQAAFDQLSGEVHASAKSAALEDSRFVREAAWLRLRSATNGIAGQTSVNDSSRPVDTTGLSLWGHGFGSWGQFDGDRDAGSSQLKRSIGGFFIGLDGAIGEDFRVGALGGYSRSTFKVNSRASSVTTDNYQAGVYGGGKLGPIGVRLGAAYGWHKLDTERLVSFAGFGDTLKADYKAHTAQAFGEFGYRIDVNGGALEPFANLAYINLNTKKFTETGGAAALNGNGDDTDVTFSTLGTRFIKDIDAAGTANVYGSLGWRRAYGGRTPYSTVSFTSGSDAFGVAGVPLAQNAAVLEAGVDATIAKGLTLGASYSGQLSRSVNDHGVKAVLGWKF